MKVWLRRFRFIALFMATLALSQCLSLFFDCRSMAVYVKATDNDNDDNSNGTSTITTIPTGTSLSDPNSYFYAGMFFYEDFTVEYTSDWTCEVFDRDVSCANRTIERIIRHHDTCLFYPMNLDIDKDWGIAQTASIMGLLFGTASTFALWIIAVFGCFSMFVHFILGGYLILVLTTFQGLTLWLRGSYSLCVDPKPLFDYTKYDNSMVHCGHYRHLPSNILALILWGATGCIIIQCANIERKTNSYIYTRRDQQSYMDDDDEETATISICTDLDASMNSSCFDQDNTKTSNTTEVSINS